MAGFWRQVVWCSHHGHGHLRGGLKDLADSEVSHLHSVVASQEQILCLDVSVDDLLAVDVLKCACDLLEPVADFSLGKLLTVASLSLDQIVQVTSFKA